MAIKRALIVSQAIPQWYVDLLTDALGPDCRIDIITGSTEIKGNIIPSPRHDAESLKSRLVCWMKHYHFMSRWMRENNKQRYDMIFAVSNPPINSYIGLRLKKVFHAPFVYMNWDLYPQVIESSIANPLVQLVCKGWHRWNAFAYPKIDQLLTIGEVMAESIRKPIKKPVHLEVIPVSVDVNRLKPVDKAENPFCVENGLTDTFTVLYSGKMGMGHNIEVILEASKLLPQVTFVFIGNGPKYHLVEDFIRQRKPMNVRLYPLQPEEIFPHSMACGDVGIVTQEAALAQLFMPSKTYSMMACGQAIVGICTEHDDLYDLLKDETYGIPVTDATAEKVAAAIQSLYDDRKKLKAYQQAARKTAVEICSNDVVKQRYQAVFARLK